MTSQHNMHEERGWLERLTAYLVHCQTAKSGTNQGRIR